MILILVVFSSGCIDYGSEETEEEETGKETFPEETTPEEEEEPEEEYKVEVTLKGKWYTDTIMGDYEEYDWDEAYPDEGKVFFVVEIKVKNNGTEAIHTSKSYVTVSCSNGLIYDYDGSSYYIDDEFESLDVESGYSNQGKISFEIPEDVTPIKLYYDDWHNEITVSITGNIPVVDYIE